MKKWNLASWGIENLCGIFSQTLNLDKIENKMNNKSYKKHYLQQCLYLIAALFFLRKNTQAQSCLTFFAYF
ncbi:hypothetical protein [Polaribacter sp. R77954]|uniref:hypothetical protein n=1 Tax=Polaribacter sp. R77954 TaxID=3093870 RepID=UPI0037CC3BE3